MNCGLALTIVAIFKRIPLDAPGLLKCDRDSRVGYESLGVYALMNSLEIS